MLRILDDAQTQPRPTPFGRPLLYNPDTDLWHLGPAIDVDNHAIALNQTPVVLFGDDVVVSGGRLAQDGELCCEPFSRTVAYPIPDGF